MGLHRDDRRILSTLYFLEIEKPSRNRGWAFISSSISILAGNDKNYAKRLVKGGGERLPRPSEAAWG